MSFPLKHEPPVSCIGFPGAYLPAIENAIEFKQVNWHSPTVFIDSCIALVDWAGCTWELEEIREMVVAIRLVKGKLNNQDLTAAILKGF